MTRRGLAALLHYGKVGDDLLEYFDLEMGDRPLGRREMRIKNIRYPHHQHVGILVAVSRLYAADIFSQHQEIVEKRGRVLFGKFRYRRNFEGDTPIDLENIRHERASARATGFLRARVEARLSSGEAIDLFVLDPDPPGQLWRGSITDVRFSEAGVGGSEADFAVPTLDGLDPSKSVPRYYWLDDDRTSLQYHCNFWFVLSSFSQIRTEGLSGMTDLETGDRITLATAQLYPAEVSLSEDALRPVADQPTPTRAGGQPKVPLDAVCRALPRVVLESHATRDLKKCHEPFLRQFVDLIVCLDRVGGDLKKLGRKWNDVIDGNHLKEFEITGAGRVAAGWLQGRWHIVGLSDRHCDGQDFWTRMKDQWRRLQPG